MFKEVDYCTCEVSKVYTEQNDMGHWDVCDICKKVIEDTTIQMIIMDEMI